jgi:hypothetical protein
VSPRPRLLAPPAPAVSAAARRVATRPVGAVTELVAAIVARVLNVAVAQIDLDAVVARIDLDSVIARVDVQRLVSEVDVDAVVDRVDVTAILMKVDMDELVSRLDVGALARETLAEVDMSELIRESTASIGSETLDAMRDQAERADGFVARVVDRALRRDAPRGEDEGPA